MQQVVQFLGSRLWSQLKYSRCVKYMVRRNSEKYLKRIFF